jgi:NADPH2:quinone reductase
MRHTRIVVSQYGGPEVFSVIEEDAPTPNAGEVRVKVLAAGVSLPDVLAREGVHPETPRVPYTPGWDLIGSVDQLGEGAGAFELGQTVAAMPIHGCYAQYLCVPQRKLVPVPAGLDPAEAVAAVLNYTTAYQMLHRSAKAQPGQRMLIHGAPGGVGTAVLQLARLAGVEMCATCSARTASVVRELSEMPIDTKEVRRLTGDRVDLGVGAETAPAFQADLGNKLILLPEDPATKLLVNENRDPMGNDRWLVQVIARGCKHQLQCMRAWW